MSQSLLEKAKMAARIKTNAFDDEITDLLNAALLDLGCAGVVIPQDASLLVERAQLTYFKMNFGQPDNYDQLKASYDEQKAQLSMRTGFTDWGGTDGQV
jgi:hypothetical protein